MSPNILARRVFDGRVQSYLYYCVWCVRKRIDATCLRASFYAVVMKSAASKLPANLGYRLQGCVKTSCSLTDSREQTGGGCCCCWWWWW
ncbi:unnamed protein product [Polarella glacialis]|uniref:Uncharacterized protein n=1 Tax=Polarella glacialis TaxID=89957 RepID=A0A813FHR7_POLGL|nr:unnamed protein product [Polarella glacialis]